MYHQECRVLNVDDSVVVQDTMRWADTIVQYIYIYLYIYYVYIQRDDMEAPSALFGIC